LTNVIEIPHSGARLLTRRVCHWREGKIVLRWAAALLMTEQNFQKTTGYRDLWMVKTAFERKEALTQGDVA